MKRIYYLYRDLTQMLGKYRAYIKPELFADALYFASRGLFDEYYGNTKDFRPGHPLPRVAYQITTSVTSALHPFLREVYWGQDLAKVGAGFVDIAGGQKAAYLLLEADGRFQLPADWVHPTALDTAEAVEDIQVLDDNEVTTTKRSLIAPPDLLHPMIEVVQGGCALLGGAQELHGKYLALPVRPVLKYVYDANDPDAEPKYDDFNSVDLDWPPSRDNQLLTRMLAYPALGLRDTLVQQVAKDMSERGQ